MTTEDSGESYEDYLLRQQCPDLVSTMMTHHLEAYTNVQENTGTQGEGAPLPLGKDPVACFRASLEETHKKYLGLEPRKSIEGLRSIGGKRIVLVADLNPACGTATLNARMEGLRQSLQCFVSLNAKVLLYADIGNVKEGSVVLPLPTADTSVGATGPGYGAGVAPGALRGDPSGTPPSLSLAPTQVPGLRATPQRAVGGGDATSPVSGGAGTPPAAHSSQPSPHAVLSAVKTVATKVRMNVKIIRNLADIGRSEFTYFTNSDLLFLPMMYPGGSAIVKGGGTEDNATNSHTRTLSSESPLGSQDPAAEGSEAPNGDSTGRASSGLASTPNERRMSTDGHLQAYHQQLAELANASAVSKTLCAFGEVIVLDHLDVGKFAHEAMQKVPRSIPDGLFGCVAAAEHKALGPLMCGASPKGKKRVLLLGDGVDGAPTALRQLLSQGTGTTVEVLANMGLLFDTIILVGKSARRYHKLYHKALSMAGGNTGSISQGLNASAPLPTFANNGSMTANPYATENPGTESDAPQLSVEEGDTLATRQLLQFIKGGGVNGRGKTSGSDDSVVFGTGGVALPQVIYAEDFLAAKGGNKKRVLVPIGGGLPSPKHRWLDVGPKTTELLVNYLSSGNVESLLWLGTTGEIPDSTAALMGAVHHAAIPVAIAGEGPVSLMAGASMASQPVASGYYSTAVAEAANPQPIGGAGSPSGQRGVLPPALGNSLRRVTSAPPLAKKIEGGEQVTILTMGIGSIASMMAAYALPALTALSPPTTNAIPQAAK